MGEAKTTDTDAAPDTDGADHKQAVKAPGDPAVWRVLLPVPLAGPLDYAGPPDLQIGAVVEVPLGSRRVVGAVWGPAEPGDAAVPAARLKAIERVFEVPALPDTTRRFVDWMAGYTLAPPGQVLQMALSCPAALVAEEPEAVVALAADLPAEPAPPFKWTAPRRRVVEQARELPAMPAAELARQVGCGVPVIRGLIEAGVLATHWRPRAAVPPRYRPGHAPADLSADQAAAASRLCDTVAAGGYSVTLIDGVTGSGKTEVYFEAIATALAGGRQVLVLLPEIALTAQWLERFEARFGAAPTQWHSRLTPLARRRAWRAAAEGTAKVVVGARSALMLPYPDLGLIVVDEEHEPAFKQEDGVHYHARDMAVTRAFLGEIPAVLCSATPSLETLVNVERGRYGQVVLPRRFGGAVLPEVAAIDLRADPPERGNFLSPPLLAEAAATLARGEQVLLFLNRRGYAPLTLCRSCGHRLRCPNCEAWLVDHRLGRRLVCHHCGYTRSVPPACPECGAVDSLTPIGPGVERIAEEVAAVLPEARTLLLTSDHLRGTADLADKMRRIRDGEVDVVIGTQLIAKGHHFPGLTLVGVVDADLGLAGGDPRAAERTYQLLSQVAGRAGRADRPGRVRLQTYDPDQPVLAALLSGDRDAFLEVEAAERAARHLPPFGRLAAIVVSAPTAAAADDAAQALARAAPRAPGLEILGPADPPLAVLQRRHRRRLLAKARREVRLQPILKDWLGRVRLPGSVRVTVDIDPYSFM
ncbi:MAG: primosomal protein N' [Rhodospirillaceae bacterium]|nr:primosomal protein N' [Rhodospirillaceae bacterium]